MPSENVVRDRRKKSRAAKTARIEGSGFRKGMAPDFVYGEDEPWIPRPFSKGQLDVFSSGDWKPTVETSVRKTKKDAKMARKLFELQQQRVPGVLPGRKDMGYYDLTVTPKEHELLDGLVKDLQRRHSDVYNPYTKREVYDPFRE